MKFSCILGAALAAAVSALPVAAHAEHSSHFQDIPLKGGLEAAKKEAAAGPATMTLSIVTHNKYDHGHTSYIWNDSDYNQIKCTIPFNGDTYKAKCIASYDLMGGRYARLTGDHSNINKPSIFDERPTQKSF